jgi:hypothetical protein
LVVAGSGSTNAYWLIGGSANISGNDYYNSNGQAINTSGVDSNPTSSNPQFADAPGGDFSLVSTSAIGFRSINQAAVGLAPTTGYWYS